VTDTSEPPVNGVLGSVRQLEEALDAVSTTRAASEARLEEARADAAHVFDAARAAAAAAVAERRRFVLGAAEDDAAEISRQGDERAARVRSDARAVNDAAVEAALALILSTADDSEA
jgi:vacuolar-type H+-ATPase subunit H